MAGNNHHYNPRWLQAGFANNGTEKKSCVWLYSKNISKPIFHATKHIGVEKHFYAYGSGTVRRSADEVMTEAETHVYSLLARELRQTSGPVRAPTAQMAEFLAHIEVRTKTFRDYSSSAVSQLAIEFNAFMTDPSRYRPVLSELMIARPEVFKLILDAFGMPVSIEYIAQLSVEVENKTGSYSAEEQHALSLFQAISWEKLFIYIAKIAHIEVMLETLASETRIQQYHGCHFEVRDFPDADFVQGDAPLIFKRRYSSEFTPLMMVGEDFDFAFLPLTSTKLLLIIKTPNPELNWKELRAACVACSRIYFIAKNYNPDFCNLLETQLATTIPTVPSNLIHIWFKEALAESKTSSPIELPRPILDHLKSILPEPLVALLSIL